MTDEDDTLWPECPYGISPEHHDQCTKCWLWRESDEGKLFAERQRVDRLRAELAEARRLMASEREVAKRLMDCASDWMARAEKAEAEARDLRAALVESRRETDAARACRLAADEALAVSAKTEDVARWLRERERYWDGQASMEDFQGDNEKATFFAGRRTEAGVTAQRITDGSWLRDLACSVCRGRGEVRDPIHEGGARWVPCPSTTCTARPDGKETDNG